MRPRYNYASPPHQDDHPTRDSRTLTVESSRSWAKFNAYRQASSFQGESTSPVSSISADLGPFLSPVPGNGVKGFRASTPLQQQSESSQSYIDQSSIPSPDQSFAVWAATEDQYARELATNHHEPIDHSELTERSRSAASSWSFAEAASINHPSVHGLSSSRPPSRYFSSDSESDQVNDEGEEDIDERGILNGEEGEHDADDDDEENVVNDEEEVEEAEEEEDVEDEVEQDEKNVILESMLAGRHLNPASNSGRRSEQSHGSRQNFLSSNFEQPNTRLWAKRGSANTSLLSQRLDRYRRDSSLNGMDRVGTSSERSRHEPDRGSQLGSPSGSLDRERYRQTESRQSDFSLKSRSRLRETWRARSRDRHNERDRQGGLKAANKDKEQEMHRQALGHHRNIVTPDHEHSNMQSSPVPSQAESNRREGQTRATNLFSLSRDRTSPRDRMQHKAKYLQSSDFSADLHGYDTREQWSNRPIGSPSSTTHHAKQTQAKAIGRTLDKLEKLLDEDDSVMDGIDFETSSNRLSKQTKAIAEGYRERPGTATSVNVMEAVTGSSKSQQLLRRIWQLQMSLDMKETELSDARRHSRWLEEQLDSARRRIDKLEHDAEARHRLQERLYKTEEAADEANHRVTDLLQINYKLVNDQESMMRQISHQALGHAVPQLSVSETPYNHKPPFSRQASGSMAELQARLRKLWDDSRQLEDYMKERSSSRLSVTGPVIDTRVRPRNPSPRLLTHQSDELIHGLHYEESDEDDDDSVPDNLADLVKLLKSESELHHHQLVKTVQLLAANVSGGDSVIDEEGERKFPHGLAALAKKIQMMERRYEEREKQLNRIIGNNRQKNKQSLLQWKKRWENQFEEWPAAVEPLLTQLESQEDEEDDHDIDDHVVEAGQDLLDDDNN